MNKAPLWIVVIATIFGVLGVVISAVLYFNPSILLFPEGTPLTSELAFVKDGWVVRNLATALAMLTAVWLRAPSALLAAFVARLATDVMDTFVSVASSGVSADIVVGLIFIVPALAAVIRLLPLVQARTAPLGGGLS